MLRVGRSIYNRDGSRKDPSYEGFTPIVVLTKSSAYGSLGPYVLKDEEGVIMENRYQGSKVYETVPYTKQFYSRWDKTVIWEHPSEVHVKDGKLTSEYWAWRDKVFKNKYALRYPLGYGLNKTVLYSFRDGHPEEKLDYIQTRKLIYVPLYRRLVREQKQFKELKERLKKGENLLIIEVDGPHQEDLQYYKDKYDVSDDFIVNNTMLVTPRNIDIMLNNTKHPFGHCYALCMELLDYSPTDI